jgi:DNA helicase-2/ATP-dependent DNA helicase PcrA
MTFEPSKFQEAIFQFVKTGSGDGIVSAVAGSGKTTTLEHAARLVKGKALFCAFSKLIATVLQERLKGTTMTAITIHSLGYGILRDGTGRRFEIKEQKYRMLAKNWLSKSSNQTLVYEIDRPLATLIKMCNFARLTMTNIFRDDDLILMCTRFNIPCEPKLFPAVRTLLKQGEELAMKTVGQIDFTDMLYLPLKLNLTPKIKYDWVFVDECQDLNTAQRELVLKVRSAGGRMLFVGDPYQAIMGFAGADTASYHMIKEITGAKEFPLSVCYRCPKEHIAMAKQLVPQIEAASFMPDGVVNFESDDSQLVEVVQEGDLIMCRRNAPLIKHCLRMIRRRVPARVRGRDVGKELADLVRMIGENCSYAGLPEAVKVWEGVQYSVLTARDASEAQFEQLSDKAEALLECYAGFTEARSAEALAAQIESIFADDTASIWLSSVHRAKGLEAPRTFILEFDRLGKPFKGATPEEAQQELNLLYVGLTRCKFDARVPDSGTMTLFN